MATQRNLPLTKICTIINLWEHWDRLRPAWDRFVDSHPKSSIFHTSSMVRVFQQTKRHAAMPLAAIDSDGQVMALLVAIRVQTLPDPLGCVSSRSIMYAEPLCDDRPEGNAALAQLIVRHDLEMGTGTMFCEVRPHFAPGLEQSALQQCGYQALEYLNYLIDLTAPREILWQQLDRRARGAIRRCEHHGIQVREATLDVAQLYRLCKLSYRHARVPLVDRSLFEAALSEFQPRGMARIFAAYQGDMPIAMDLILLFKSRAYVWYAGFDRSAVVSPCANLRWHGMQWAQEHGFSLFDMGGAGWPDKPYGVRDFKRKLGGQLVQFGRYRKYFSPWKLAVVERAYEFRRAIRWLAH
jgi:serine/alanine adding enzyme